MLGRGPGPVGGATGRLSGAPVLSVCPPAVVNPNVTASESALPSAPGRSTTCRYWAARLLSSTHPPAGMVTLIVLDPAALGLGEADGDGDADADAAPDGDADPEGLALPDALGEAAGAMLETIPLGTGTALGDTGTEQAGALLALGATLLP